MEDLTDAKSECRLWIQDFERKAVHNKRESLNCFILVIGCTLIAPLFITLGDGLIVGKLIPSVLALFSAGATAWLQLRKPQQLWAIYRTAQRELEANLRQHHFSTGAYAAALEPDKLLVESLTNIVLGVHYQWLPLIPNPENLRALETRLGNPRQGQTPTQQTTAPDPSRILQG